ncbi:MAG: DUF4331 domain-containing protein [Candidatus Limnocylindria bacterium]
MSSLSAHPTRTRLLILLAVAGLAMALLVPAAIRGSSHREAPLIAKDPTADNTDLYAFVNRDDPATSANDANTVTIIANFIPLEEPAGGPNFHNFDDNVLYEIKIDNNGDAVEDITYEFRFTTRIQNPNTFLYNTGQITAIDDPDYNYRQTYTVTRVTAGGRQLLNKDGQTLRTPPANIGPRSTPNYAALANAAVYPTKADTTVFAGPTDDAFFVDLGSIFDLGGLRPFNAAHLIPLGQAPGVDGVGGFNTHTIALKVNRSELGQGNNANDIVGIYASASRQTTTVLNANGTQSTSGDWRQVSRLGNPLINEVIIPLGKKDKWNASDPKDDAQFLAHYTTPELAALINLLYPSLPDVATTNRTDLVAVLLTGVDGLNFTGTKPADLLRLNMGIPACTADSPTDTAGKCSRLGVLSGDLAGFPNGRRLTDDVTDIELRAVAQGYGPFLATNFGLPNKNPNNDVGDGVNENDLPLRTSFPYIGLPHQGYEHTHHRVGSVDTGTLRPN